VTPWHAAVCRTAESLAAALACDPGVPDVDTALCARAAVLDHVATVLADVVPRTRGQATRRVVPLTLVETDPLAALGHVLRGRRRPELGRSPSELLDPKRACDPLTGHWAAAGRHALIAGRDWTGHAVGPLDPAAAWHAVGEVAALAQAVAVLDQDLLAAAGGRTDVAAVIASTAGLRLAARETITLAAPDGPPRAGGSPPARPDATAINEALAARSDRPSTLPKEVRRLTHLLDQAPELTPHHIRAGALVTRDLCVLAARDAVSFTGADLRQELGDLARCLHAAARHDRGEFALNPVRARVLEFQLRDLRATTKLAFANGQGFGPEESTALARRLPDVVEILADKTRAQIDNARWALPDRTEAAELPYTFASSTEPAHTPPSLGALSQAAAAAGALREKAAPPSRPAPEASAVHALSAARPSIRPARAVHPAAVAPRNGPGLSR